jgi:hypothetical protein
VLLEREEGLSRLLSATVVLGPTTLVDWRHVVLAETTVSVLPRAATDTLTVVTLL